jgi:integrase/recombinase XerD
MKHNRSGQSRILDASQLDQLADALPAGPHFVIAMVTRFTACRITECLRLRWGYISTDSILFPNRTTKSGKSREVPLHPRLALALNDWKAEWANYSFNGRQIHERLGLSPGVVPGADHYLFPGLTAGSHMTRQSYDRVLRTTLQSLSITGASSHSMRRSSLTKAADAGTPLRHLQAISGHSSLDVLQKYLGCTDAQKAAAVNSF